MTAKDLVLKECSTDSGLVCVASMSDFRPFDFNFALEFNSTPIHQHYSVVVFLWPKAPIT